MKSPFAFVLTGGSVLALDFLTKSLIRAKLPLGGEVAVLPFFSIVHVQNTGIAFGLFHGANTLLLVLGVGIAAALIFGIVRIHGQDRFTALVLSAVVGAALGNLTDRVLFGSVTDFLDFHLGGHHWPAFNVADSTICVSAALLVWRGLKHG